MIVSREEARWITQGKKTALRIPVKLGQDEPRWKPGRDYAIEVIVDRPESELYGFTSTIVVKPGERDRKPNAPKTRKRRGKHARTVCRIAIDTVRSEQLRDLDVTAARREGFKTTSEYRGWWENTAGRDWNPDQQVWVLEFHLRRDYDDQIRFMHERSEHGYTPDRRQALAGEDVPVVDEATLSRYAKEARARREAELAELPLEDIAEEARRRGIDVSHHTRVIDERRRRMARQLAQLESEEPAA